MLYQDNTMKKMPVLCSWILYAILIVPLLSIVVIESCWRALVAFYMELKRGISFIFCELATNMLRRPPDVSENPEDLWNNQ